MLATQNLENGTNLYMSTFAKRLIEIRKSKNWEQTDLAQHAGITQQTISAIESGKTLQPRNIKKISDALNCNEQWLLYGTGSRSKEGIIPPFLSWKELSEWCKIRAPIIKEKEAPMILPSSFNKNCFVVAVEDDSMFSASASSNEMSFSKDSLIVIDPDGEPKHQSFVIAYEKNAPAAIFKQLIIDGARKFLRPLNSNYPTIPFNDDISICGIVVADFRVHR